MYSDNNALFIVVEQLIELTRAIEHKKCITLGLDDVHLQVLDYLSKCNKFSDTSTALAEYLGLTRGAISQTLTLLEKKGLIAKKNDSKDRRLIHLALTSTGQTTLEQGKSIEAFEKARANLKKDEDFAQHTKGFVSVVKALQKASNSKTFGICKTCYYFTKTEDFILCGYWKQVLTTADKEKISQFHTEKNWWQ